MNSDRNYRAIMIPKKMNNYILKYKKSDIHCSIAGSLPSSTSLELINCFNTILNYIKKNPIFYNSLVPITMDNFAPKIIKEMIRASNLANTGPMACVASAVNNHLKNYLIRNGKSNFILENGGDILLYGDIERIIKIYSGNSPLNNKIKIKIDSGYSQLGVCTSAGTIGPSLSLGTADAAVVISKDILLADALATYIGNMVKEESDINYALEYGYKTNNIEGILIIKNNSLGAIGNINLV